jgi:hypothetical protein
MMVNSRTFFQTAGNPTNNLCITPLGKLRGIADCLLFFFSLLSFNTDNYIFGYYFIGLGLLSSFFYPLYQGAYYRRHYQKYITETFKNRIDQTATITFTSARIECFDKTGEFKINLVEIEEIFETGEYFYLKIKSGVSLIIPKSKVENTDDLRTELMSISENLKANYSIELNWRWK